jgi:uncharacterized membrane-anchored protein
MTASAEITPMRRVSLGQVGMERGAWSPTLPRVTLAFWATKLLVTVPAEMIGQIINQWGKLLLWPATATLIIVAFVGAAGCRIASVRLAGGAFWTATFGITILTTVLAERVDITLGIGDVPACLHLAIVLLLCFVLDYRITGTVPMLPYGWRQEPFFWTGAVLAQMFASAVADWLLDPGGPGVGLAVGPLAAGILMASALYFFKPVSRAIVFWAAFVLAGVAGALAGQMLLDRISALTG